MNVKFLGTAASEGIPNAFCHCKVCEYARINGGNNVRSRAGLIIDGQLLIDFSPDILYQAYKNDLDFRKINNILFTHSHEDHLSVNDLCYRILIKDYENVINLYGNSAVKQQIDNYLDKYHYKFEKGFTYIEVEGESCFKVGKYTVYALSSSHITSENALIYIVSDGEKTYLHCTDSDLLSETTLNYLKDTRLLINAVALDLTYGTITNDYHGHMNIIKAKKFIDDLKSIGVVNDDTQYYATHICHMAGSNDELERQCSEIGVKLAYDGLELNI